MATPADQRAAWLLRWRDLIVAWENLRHNLKREKVTYTKLDLGNTLVNDDFAEGSAFNYTTKTEFVSTVSSFDTTSSAIESGFHDTNFEQLRP